MKQIIQSDSKLFENFFYLEDLYPLKDNSFKEKNIGLILITIFYNILKVLLKLLLNFKIKQEKYYFNNKVFFSHINPSFLNDKKEKYFGDMINDKKDIFYIKHVKKKDHLDGFQIFPKSLSIGLELKIIIKLFVDFTYFLFLIITKFKSKKYYSIFLANFISPSSALNLRYYYAIKNNILGNNNKKVFITFEGYAYERSIIKSSKEIGNKIFAYQHGAINNYNSSIFFRLNHALMPDKILTSGSITYDYFLNKGFSVSEICIMGSNRSNNYSYTLKDKENYLIIPNGTFIEHEKLFDFVLKISKKKKKSKFYFKAHPEILFDKEYQNKDNLIVIDQLQEKILIDCKYVIYTKSSYVINFVSSGMIPLFFNYEGLKDNILANYNNYIEIKDDYNFSFDLKIYNTIKKDILHFSKNYYTELNLKKFNSIINI